MPAIDRPDDLPPYPLELERRLFDIATGLRRLGRTVAMLTLVDVFIALLFSLPMWYANAHLLALLAVGLGSVITIMLLVVFEQKKREGDVYFQEISDELKDSVAQASPREVGSGEVTREELRMLRLTLRQFAASAELPLLPTRSGPAIYAGLNLLAATLMAFRISNIVF